MKTLHRHGIYEERYDMTFVKKHTVCLGFDNTRTDCAVSTIALRQCCLISLQSLNAVSFIDTLF